jgi:hypothetical protein
MEGNLTSHDSSLCSVRPCSCSQSTLAISSLSPAWPSLLTLSPWHSRSRGHRSCMSCRSACHTSRKWPMDLWLQVVVHWRNCTSDRGSVRFELDHSMLRPANLACRLVERRPSVSVRVMVSQHLTGKLSSLEIAILTICTMQSEQ